MFDNIKKGLAKAAPWFCYVEEVQPAPDVVYEEYEEDDEETHSVTDIVKDVTEKAKGLVKFVGKIFVEVVPVNEETPMDLASQAVDAAVTSAANAVVIGATTMFTAKYALPIRLVSGAVAMFTATQAAQKMKDCMVHPKVEEYKAKIKTVCAAQYIDPEFNVAVNNYFKDGATYEEKSEAVNTIVGAVYPTDDMQNRLFIDTNGDPDMMVAVCMEVMERRAIKKSKLYTEFLNKPFVEQKWFVKAKNWCKTTKERFSGFPKFLAEGAPVMAMIIAANVAIANFALAKDNASNKEVTVNA